MTTYPSTDEQRIRDEARRILATLPPDPHAQAHRIEMERHMFDWKGLAWRPWSA